jgi:hypothetical protein
MELNRRTRTIFFIVIIILLLLAILVCRGCSGSRDGPSTEVNSTEGSTTEPVIEAGSDTSGLVGMWDSSSSVLGDIRIVIDKTAPIPDSDEGSQYVSGYVVFGEDPLGDPIAPLSGVAVSTGEGLYEVQIWSTDLSPVIEAEDIEDVHAHPILFTGLMDTGEGEGEGQWESGEESGDWQTEHQAEVAPDSPAFDLEHSGLRIDYGVTASIHTEDQNGTTSGQYGQLEVLTNIAVSEVVVLTPDGGEIILEHFTDIFSPGVDFISEFRFGIGFEGLPEVGEYVFNFHDPMGEPLPGVKGVDVWGGCQALAPLNVRGSVGSDGIMISWSQVPGFDPSNPEGFYQIEIYSETDEGKHYGSNHIQQTSHLIPYATFSPGSIGYPDGENYGTGLSQLGDGSYDLVVYVFMPAKEGIGQDCQVMAEDEVVTVEKSGGEFAVNP